MEDRPPRLEALTFCCRCDRAIKPGEPYDRHIHDRATGVPLTTYSHRDREACARRR
ncbi:hypothetical protein ACX6XY_21195 [Streptomyces sp. O3]